MTSRHLGMAVKVFCALALAATAIAQEIGQVRWGFDGAVAPGRFNLLTLVVHNPSADAVDDALVLTKHNVWGRVGAEIVEPCFLSPRSSRVVQLFPFVVAGDERWHVRFRSSGGTTELPRPRIETRVAVLFESQNLSLLPRAGLKVFPTTQFPTIAGCADVLSDVVLDHAPEWDANRRAAFLDWIRGGGHLHLLLAGDRYPTFAGDLAILNRPDPRYRVGAGTVQRYPIPRADLDDQRLELAATRLEQVPDQPASSGVSDLLVAMKPPPRVRHRWSLIFLLAIGFVIAVGPLQLIIARKLDYRLSTIALLGTITVFTWLFVQLGARGSGERATVTTLCYAKRLANGEWDVTGYTDIFATTSDTYRIDLGGRPGLLSTAHSLESVTGTIDNGVAASISVDIPLFSSRSLVHRLRCTGPAFHVTRAPDRGFSIDGDFPEADFVVAWFANGATICGLSREGRRLEPMPTRRNLMAAELIGRRDAPEEKLEFGALVAPLIVERHFLHSAAERASFESREHTDVFVLARSPRRFRPRGPQLGEHDSYVVYHLEVRD